MLSNDRRKTGTGPDTEIKRQGLSRDDNYNSSAQAIRTGLPQGSLASLVIASKVLQPHLGALGSDLALTHVDNVMVGGKTEEQARSMLTALAFSLEKQPAGSLCLTTEVYKIGDPRMNFLGYRFRRRSIVYGGFGRATPSEQSFNRFHRRIAYRLLLGVENSEGFIAQECARYVRSFPHWSNRLECEDFAVLHIELELEMRVWRLRRDWVRRKVKWFGFDELKNDLYASARSLADAMGRMHTQGGDPLLVGRLPGVKSL